MHSPLWAQGLACPSGISKEGGAGAVGGFEQQNVVPARPPLDIRQVHVKLLNCTSLQK